MHKTNKLINNNTNHYLENHIFDTFIKRLTIFSRTGPTDPDQDQNETDPKHCILQTLIWMQDLDLVNHTFKG